jgi:NAD(P)-dependent dehydrogenase (short-subunit alcohol dehydrogenase family)
MTSGKRGKVMNMTNRLDEAVAVVTGAASGIGLRTCELFLDKAMTVVGVDQSKVPGELAGRHRFREITADVSDAAQVGSLSERVRDLLGRCDVLVNCAGVLINGTVTETTEDEWDRTMAVNLRGAWLTSRALIPLIASSGGGAIVSVAAGAGLRPLPGLAAYAASKAALISLARSIAIEYEPVGIRSNCVCPGPTNTPMFVDDELNIRARDLNGGAWARALAQPEEIANAILFLSSPEMSTLTGATLAIDSGRVLH